MLNQNTKASANAPRTNKKIWTAPVAEVLQAREAQANLTGSVADGTSDFQS